MVFVVRNALLHFFDKARDLSMFKVTPTATFLTPCDVQAQTRTRDADIHQTSLFFNPQWVFEQFITQHMRQQAFLHAHEKNMWVLQALRGVQG